MSIIVYYWSNGPQARGFEPTELTQALKFAEEKRKLPEVSHVCIASELPNSVGKAGVDEVDADYDWSKQHRGNHGTLER